MIKCFYLLFFSLLLAIEPIKLEAQDMQHSDERRRDFSSDWRFMTNGTIDASGYDYDDRDWEQVNIPHDFSILPVGSFQDTPRDTNTVGFFSKVSEDGAFTGHTAGGVGWYRKTFTLEESDRGKSVKIHFDGIYSESEVWVNGHKLGMRPNGYVPFYYDLTNRLYYTEKPNIIVVKCQNIGENSRWYAGSGIYRYVQLSITNPVHIDTWGLAVTTDRLDEQRAELSVKTTLANQSVSGANVKVLSEIVDHHGHVVARETKETDIAAKGKATTHCGLTVTNPRPWSPIDPYRYVVRVVLLQNGQAIDIHEEKIGVRTIEVDADSGLRINGKPILLKGANIHHDHGFLGARAHARAEERKVELLKANGFNAIRASHNPPSDALLEACDRLGMLVMNEFFDMWERPKKPNDYHQYFNRWHESDLGNVIARDRNRASVILWSIGNEISERADSSGIAIARRLVSLAKQLDPSRPVTAGVCDFWDHKGRPWEDTDLAFQFLDVAGYNYRHDNYSSDHLRHPRRVMLGTESYAQEAYDNWQKVQEMPWVVGDFVWTGMDYIGEAGIGHSVLDQKAVGNLLPWPWYNAWCGDLDITGFKKPQSYYRDVVWGLSKLEIAVRPPVPKGSTLYTSKWGWPLEQQSWTWPGNEGQFMTLAIYAAGPDITVIRNGKTIAERQVDADSKWITLIDVPYDPGAITVVTSDHQGEVARRTLVTAGQPAALRAVTNQSILSDTGDDLSFIQIAVVDDSGNVVPTASLSISLSVEGVGTLVGAGNGSPTDLKSFNSVRPTVFEGRALAIVKADKGKGTMTFTVEAEGLAGAKLDLTVRGSSKPF